MIFKISVQMITVIKPFLKVYGTVPISKSVGDKNVKGINFRIVFPISTIFNTKLDPMLKARAMRLAI